MTAFTITANQKISLKNIFRTNLHINGLDTKLAESEMGFIMASDLVVGTKQNYLMARRAGAEICLNRAMRIKIYEIFQTSLNQLAFEMGV